jgi:hypothetical protein
LLLPLLYNALYVALGDANDARIILRRGDAKEQTAEQ